jgi:hypothetical protein
MGFFFGHVAWLGGMEGYGIAVTQETLICRTASNWLMACKNQYASEKSIK